ncbi:hypothetical protein [Rubrivirga sp.]|uniref:hypothetical protein n=1 Tax=Rubrivirga sp. TaxID=1885344 RepID=UPI003B51E036
MPEPFPVHLLRPREGTLSGAQGEFSITVPFAPFELATPAFKEDRHELRTKVVIDTIQAQADEPAALANQTLTLPTNPEPGYADGSVYIVHAHVPFDTTRIAFGALARDVIEAEISGRLLPEYVRLGYGDVDVVLRARLRVVP